MAGGSGGVCAWSQQPPVLVSADGACEQEGKLVTHEVLLADPVTGRKEVFGAQDVAQGRRVCSSCTTRSQSAFSRPYSAQVNATDL